MNRPTQKDRIETGSKTMYNIFLANELFMIINIRIQYTSSGKLKKTATA